MAHLQERLTKYLQLLKEKSVKKSEAVSGIRYKACGYKAAGELPPTDEQFAPWEEDSYWGGKADSHAWFYAPLVCPKPADGESVRLSVQTSRGYGWDAVNPQFMAYIDGKLSQGLDTNHTHVYLDGDCELMLYAYSGAKTDDKMRLMLCIETVDDNTEQLYFDIAVPYGVLAYSDPESKEYNEIVYHLNKAADLVKFSAVKESDYSQSVTAARAYLNNEFYGKTAGAPTVTMLGHSHVDIAWLWTIAQTREKVQRTFSTALALMDRYPEYKFFSSQPILYRMFREEAPELFERLRERVREGRWEPEGGMWVEADCNLTSGESLIRQILYGKRFFMREFGVDCKILWLPDVFGYSGALPQILKKCGIETFVTAKINWNDTNRFPYEYFRWQGIDGSEVNAYFITTQEAKRGLSETMTTYVGLAEPSFVSGTYRRFTQKYLTDDVLMTYGWGDGGGGPTREFLENIRRMEKGIPGCPRAVIGTAENFFARLKEKTANKPLPVWRGEMYLEYHRGTYTSMARNKRDNRKSEIMLRFVESLSCTLALLTGEKNSEDFGALWQTVLTDQFHDILPGSSIKEVYDDTRRDYRSVLGTCESASENMLRKIAGGVKGKGVLVYNPLSYARSGPVRYGGQTYAVGDIPAKGFTLAKLSGRCGVRQTDDTLENEFYKLTFDDTFLIKSIYCKDEKQELLSGTARIEAYEDYPYDYDAWEISDYYARKVIAADAPESVSAVTDGIRKGFKITRNLLKSTIEQTVWLYDGYRGIDFETRVDMRDEHILLKAVFPVRINATKATYDVQFGAVERSTLDNTSYDRAAFEVCGHKFVDYSEYGFGAALLSDSKYGYSVKNGVMTMSLLKSATYPNPEADKEAHAFTYRLLPHGGDYRAAGVVRQAYELNEPMSALKADGDGSLPSSYSLAATDAEGVFIETFKEAENGDGYVLRAYEAFNRKTEAVITTGFPFTRVILCDMTENESETLPAADRAVTVRFEPYEIVTLKFKTEK